MDIEDKVKQIVSYQLGFATDEIARLNAVIAGDSEP